MTLPAHARSPQPVSSGIAGSTPATRLPLAILAILAIALAAGCGDDAAPATDAGVPPGGEICGDSIDNDDDGAIDCVDSDCPCPDCGDGVVGPGEECDDGNPSDDDDCLVGCLLARCGDGHVDSQGNDTEECDDAGESANCDYDCTAVECGDGILNSVAGEECDSPNGMDSANCDADCTLVACGDGRANAAAGEQCDDAGESITCDLDCTFAVCGDEVVNATANEACDGGGVNTQTCDLDCTLPECGDGVPNTAAGEECDGAGQTAQCDIDCTAPLCGDNLTNTAAGEACDSGAVNTAVCDADCSLPVCGDSLLNTAAGEVCDSGGVNTASCDFDCTAPVCGDDITNNAAGEQCDDGNNLDGDGCAADCTNEVTSCVQANGLTWCYDPNACGQACNQVCASLGLTPVASTTTWFQAQDTVAECQAISNAFGIATPVDIASYTFACMEDTFGTHAVGGGLVGPLYCSSSSTCPGNHLNDMDQLGVPCGTGSRRSICPCE